MLKWLLSAMINSGIGDHFDGGTGGDLASLTSMLAAEKNKKKGDQPLDRLQDAFKQLKDMHKDPALAQALPLSPSNGPSPFDNAQWPYGPVGAPSQAMAASAPTPTPAPMSTPLPAPRPPEAPQAGATDGPFTEFFKRNTAMMKDPMTGAFLDPSAAAQHGGSGILNGLFG